MELPKIAGIRRRRLAWIGNIWGALTGGGGSLSIWVEEGKENEEEVRWVIFRLGSEGRWGG